MTGTLTPPAARTQVTLLDRGVFTEQLHTYLVQHTPVPVLWGLGEAPVAGGWTGDEPGKGSFVPYCVLRIGPGVPNMVDALARRSGQSWRLTYLIATAGADMMQAEYSAQKGRMILAGLHQFVVNDGTHDWKILKSEYAQLGAVVRNDATDPPTYEGVDTLEIWVERR
jgi:hypothetical protein